MNHGIGEDGAGMPEVMAGKSCIQRGQQEKQKHNKTGESKRGPEVGVSRAHCPQHWDYGPGLLSGPGRI